LNINRRRFVGLSAAAIAAPHMAFAGQSLNIVCTVGMLADTAKQIAPSHTTIRALMGHGTDPHAFRQTRSDVVALTKADLIIRHGLYLEAQMEDLFAKLGKRKSILSAGEAVPNQHLLPYDDALAQYDPHVWMAPTLWEHVASAIAIELSSRLPKNSVEIAENHARFVATLKRLTGYGHDILASVPKQARVLLTAHDAFRYFGSAYDFDVMGVKGISTTSEAGLYRIEELVDLIIERQIKAVFVESSQSDRNIRALIEGTAARDHDLKLGGQLFSDAMGPAGTYEGTYVGMMDHNLTTIARALGVDAPTRGMNDKLNV
jgi:manganese/zinc/iron transport system substrate-binding protein